MQKRKAGHPHKGWKSAARKSKEKTMRLETTEKPTEPYAVSEELLREAILDDGLSRGALKQLATARQMPTTPEILDWAKRVMLRAGAPRS